MAWFPVRLGAAAPPALVKLLPLVDAALAALAASKTQPTGRPGRSPAYSTQVLESAMSLDLILGDLLAWATSQATETRYGSLARAIAPKRRNDAPSETGGKGGKGEATGAGAAGAKGDGADSSATKTDGAAASNGAANAQAPELKNAAAAPAAQA